MVMKRPEIKINLMDEVDDKVEKREQHIWYSLLPLLL